MIILLVLLSYANSSAQKISVGANINTEFVEYAPSISADGKTMIYQSNKDGRYKLYITHKNGNDVWGDPVSIDAINDYGEENDLIGGPSISYDGNYIYFFASFSGGLGAEDIYYSEKRGDSWGEPVNIGAPINSRNYEGFPSISADGNKLYFMRFSGIQKYEGKFCYQLYIAVKNNDGRWGRPAALPAPVNKGCEKCPRIMSDDETLIFSAIRGESTSDNNFDLYVTRKLTSGRWTEPVAMDFINTSADEIFGSVPSTGDMLFLNIQGEVSQDIFTVPIPKVLRPKMVINVQGKVRESGSGKPLGASFIIIQDGDTLNTGGLSSNPFDGNYTVVLTQGKEYKIVVIAPGYEPRSFKYDLTNLEDYQLFENDIELDRYIGEMQLFITNEISGDTILANVSVNNSKIRQQNRAYSFKVEYDSSYQAKVIKPGYKPLAQSFKLQGDIFDKVINNKIILTPENPSLNVIVLDKETGQPLKSYLQFFNQSKRQTIFKGMVETGEFASELKFNTLYSYRITRPRYFYYQDTIDLRNVYYGRSVRKTVELNPLKKGAKLTLNSINFEINSAALTDSSKIELDNVFNLLKQNRNIVLEIAAHSDDSGDASYNMILSRQRAKSVEDYLISKGAPQAMLASKGYGESRPLVPNNTDENKALNRRVEFIVLKVK